MSEIGSHDWQQQIKELSFEEALKQLDDIVRKMEDSELALEDSMDSYELGIHLARLCRAKLDMAQGRIEALEKVSEQKPLEDDMIAMAKTESNSKTAKKGKNVRKKNVSLNDDIHGPVIKDDLQGTLL